MRKDWVAGLAVMAAPAVAVAGQAQTVQQQFEAADRLDASGTPDQRVAAWDALQKRVANNKRSLAVVRIRKAQALFALGRKDEAIAELKAGIADLPATDASLRSDRFTATLQLGQIAASAIDYPTALQRYEEARRLAQGPSETMSALLGMLKVQTYLDPEAAARTAAEAGTLVANAQFAPSAKAEFHRLDGERLLNRGDFAAAQKEADAAVKLLGGLTERTGLDDVRVRSDYAIAALLAGRTDDARRYLAMSGAGRQKGSTIFGGAMTPPDCGGEAGLKPADMAVVEFSIGDDGSVIQVEPVYAAGGGAVALEFAKAVKDWAWTPEQAKAIVPFYRYRVRVELRCSTGFERPSINTYLDERLGAWLATKSVDLPEPPTGSDVAVLPRLRTQRAAIETRSGPDSLALVPVLQMIAANRLAPREEAHADAVRALAILDANGVSGIARLAVAEREIATRGAETKPQVYARALRGELGKPVYADDPEARSALRIMLAQAALRDRDSNAARVLLTQAGDDAALPKTSALRSSALVQLASLEEASGNPVAARAAFGRSGLDPSQCALVDAPPSLVKVGGTFPMEAQQWGFEGFTRVQFDVDAEGRVQKERTVIAYPAFVFSKAGSETLRTARYSKTYRPDGSAGCGGATRAVRFALP